MNKLDEQFKRLNKSLPFNEQTKNKLKYKIFNIPQKPKRLTLPKLIIVLFTIFVLGMAYFSVLAPLIKSNEYSQGEIIDNITPYVLPEVDVSDGMYTIEWLSDSMDRGNHDLITDVHGDFVVSNDTKLIKRGNIVYYHYDNQEYIGRIIGLPGETVEIKEGQVYIDKKVLNTFYGVATNLGLNQEEYFERVQTDNVNIREMEEYFNTTMKPIKVEQDTLFILTDMWWRGKDSRELGLVPLVQLEGVILGYEK
ncbi:signal peptidase I [Oceanobacillus sp. FSL H7-0719]|uniref:signal peptidase I n=1 Tax=Oceanobacillus sp. FSL H7-0719 TaxID=2954507 RepID=UPI00324B03C1